MKFKLGDNIKGKPNTERYYGVTNEHMTKAIVINVYDNTDIEIKVLEHDEKQYVGQKFRVCPAYFDLVKRYKEKLHRPIVIYSRDREVIAVDKNTGKKAIARCCPEDTFDFETGAKIAFNRLLNVKEVKRHARPGEYIKIVRSPTTIFDEYKLGDILKVIKVGSHGQAYYKHDTLKYADRNEYVVLEGYGPDGIVPNKVDEKPTYNGRIIFTKGDDTFKTAHIYEIKNGRIKLDSGIYPLAEPFKDIDDVKDFFTASAPGRNGYGWSHETLELIEVKDD